MQLDNLSDFITASVKDNFWALAAEKKLHVVAWVLTLDAQVKIIELFKRDGENTTLRNDQIKLSLLFQLNYHSNQITYSEPWPDAQDFAVTSMKCFRLPNNKTSTSTTTSLVYGNGKNCRVQFERRLRQVTHLEVDFLLNIFNNHLMDYFDSMAIWLWPLLYRQSFENHTSFKWPIINRIYRD